MLRCGEKTENTMQVMDVELSSCSEPEWVAWQEYLAARVDERVNTHTALGAKPAMERPMELCVDAKMDIQCTKVPTVWNTARFPCHAVPARKRVSTCEMNRSVDANTQKRACLVNLT